LLEPPVHAARSARGGPRSVSSARRQLPATTVGTVLDAHAQRLEPLSHLVGGLEIAPLSSQLPLFEDQADGALERSAGVVVRDPGSGWHAEYPFEEVVEQRRGSSTVRRSRAVLDDLADVAGGVEERRDRARRVDVVVHGLRERGPVLKERCVVPCAYALLIVRGSTARAGSFALRDQAVRVGEPREPLCRGREALLGEVRHASVVRAQQVETNG